MAAPGSVDSGANVSPSLFSSLRSLWSVLVATLYTRLDLVTLELEEEAVRAVKLLLIALAALLAFSGALFFAMFFLLALVWNTVYRLPLLGIISVLWALAGVALVMAVKKLAINRPKFLSQTLQELRHDVESFHPHRPAASSSVSNGGKP